MSCLARYASRAASTPHSRISASSPCGNARSISSPTSHRSWICRCPPVGHGDAHLGNTYLDAHGQPAFLDWQCIHFAPPLHDAAYFLAGALTVADRRAHERELTTGYLGELARYGGPDLDVTRAWTDHRLQTMYGYVWALTSPHMQTRDRITAMANRYLTAIEDHDSIGLTLRTAGDL